MRYLILCDGSDEPAILAEATRTAVVPEDRIIILSSRGGLAWQTGAILSVPLRWALQSIALPFWVQRHRMQKTVTLVAGLPSARVFGGVEDLLLEIDACDPDIIDLSRLGAFGKWLRPKCVSRFPCRTVLVRSDKYSPEQQISSWRTYNRKAPVSIVLPVYNGAQYLGLSIESCLKQTHDNLELIIVDDSSIDDTAAIIKHYAARDHRIRPVRNHTNLGLPEALNVGFREATGRFLTWTSHDNLYAPAAIEYMVQQLCTFTEVGLVYCSAHPIDDRGNLIDPPYFAATLPPTALARWSVIGGCFLYRREVMELVGLYRPECRLFEDLDFFIRACTKFPARYCFEPHYFYRHHSGSLTSTHSDGGRNWKLWQRRVRDEHLRSRRNRILLPTADQLIPNGLRAGNGKGDTDGSSDAERIP